KAVARGDRANLGLEKSTHWKKHAGEDLLVHRIEKVTLIFPRIGALRQKVVRTFWQAPAVMARRHAVRAELHRLFEECFELDLTIAEHVGVWRVTCLVLRDELNKDVLPVFSREVHRVVRNLKPLTHANDIRVIGVGGTGA